MGFLTSPCTAHVFSTVPSVPACIATTPVFQKASAAAEASLSRSAAPWSTGNTRLDGKIHLNGKAN